MVKPDVEVEIGPKVKTWEERIAAAEDPDIVPPPAYPSDDSVVSSATTPSLSLAAVVPANEDTPVVSSTNVELLGSSGHNQQIFKMSNDDSSATSSKASSSRRRSSKRSPDNSTEEFHNSFTPSAIPSPSDDTTAIVPATHSVNSKSSSNNSFDTAAGDTAVAPVMAKPTAPIATAKLTMVDTSLHGSITSSSGFSYIGAVNVNVTNNNADETFYSPEKITPARSGGSGVSGGSAASGKEVAVGEKYDADDDEVGTTFNQSMQSLVDVPLAGPLTPAMGDLTTFLDQAVYSLEELGEHSQRGGQLNSSIASSTGSTDLPPPRDLLSQDTHHQVVVDRNPSPFASNNNNNANQEEQQSQATASSLPSYGFQSSITEKSDRILKSFRPATTTKSRIMSNSSSRKFGTSLSAWRGSYHGHRRTSSASATSLASVGENNYVNGDDGTTNSTGSGTGTALKKKTGENNGVRTEVTDSINDDDDEDEEGGGGGSSSTSCHPNLSLRRSTTIYVSESSVGSLLKDTYSFIYVYSACPPSAPFLYALTLFLFQALVYALLLSSLIDMQHPSNPLHVPPSVSLEMRIAQACAILIAAFNSVDIMVAMNNLLRTPDAIVVMNSGQSELSSMHHGIAHDRSQLNLGSSQASAGQSFPAGFRFKFANMLRLIEGCLAVMASFILIVRSDDVIDMFINFAALEFVVNLDNLAFALAEHGLVSNKLQDAARFVGNLGFSYTDHQQGITHAYQTNTSRFRCRRLSRVLGWPVRQMKTRPDATRRSTLLFMIIFLFGCWGFILSGLNHGDSLCKSLDVEFYHAHVPATTEFDAEDGIKAFLSTRSGTYAAEFIDQSTSFKDVLSAIFMGKSKLFLAYREVDPKIETPDQETRIVPVGRLPENYQSVIYFDSLAKQWVFTSCNPNTDLSSPNRECTGPQVVSVETDTVDLTVVASTAPFHVANGNNPDAVQTILPARVTCNECGLLENSNLRSVGSNMGTCGLTGGVCLSSRRECICPPGQYGVFCTDHYGATCPTLEIIRKEGVEEPPGAVQFSKEEMKPFELVQDEFGAGNSPIWQRQSKTYTDLLEWRGGTHWTITRNVQGSAVPYTTAIAEASAPEATDNVTPGALVGPMGSVLSVQPPPAGLMFHAPKSATWGTVPDHLRPFASYTFHCKAAL